MAAEIELPEHIFVHGYLLMDGEKMSKSLGNVLDPFEVIERFGADALRFYLLRDVPFGQDGSVSTASFELRYETELANELGNLASRTIAMLLRYRDGQVPAGEGDPLLAADFAGLAERVAAHVDRAELTAALEEIWQRVRRLNRYVEEQAPWQLAKDEDRAVDLDRVLRTLVEGLRVVTVLLWPYLPASAERLLDALGAPDVSLAGAELGAGRIERVRALEALFPKETSSRSGMIDSHTHLDLCEPPNSELVAAAQDAGVQRILTVGIDGASCRAALAAAEDFPQVYAAIGRHPNAGQGLRRRGPRRARGLAAHERCLAIGETGLDFYRDGTPRADQERAFAAQIALARETGKPLVIHSRAAQETLAQLAAEAEGVSVVMHCFSMPEQLEECLERGYAISFAGNVTYPSAEDLAVAARRVPDERILVETDAPT